MRLRISHAARSELQAIADHIALDSVVRARSFPRELLDRCATLRSQPERYPIVAEIEGSIVRRMPHHRYVILYAVEVDEVRILHIVHSARDYMRILFPEA
jgi:plasmid stabilization system protein ParE